GGALQREERVRVGQGAELARGDGIDRRLGPLQREGEVGLDLVGRQFGPADFEGGVEEGVRHRGRLEGRSSSFQSADGKMKTKKTKVGLRANQRRPARPMKSGLRR